MAIGRFSTWIERHRLSWLAAILLAATLASGECLSLPAMAATMTASGSVADCPMLHNKMPGSCCLKSCAAAHTTAIPVSDSSPRLSAPCAGHVAITGATLTVSAVTAERSLRPPIRAPAVFARPLYLLNCTLLN